jgi:antitoxin (DNA-binding transcriptional repressor) of toxin-antitoxin stability system
MRSPALCPGPATTEYHVEGEETAVIRDGTVRAASWTGARQKREPIIVTRHGKPYALIQPIAARDLEALDWARLADQRLREAWDDEDDGLYDYL